MDEVAIDEDLRSALLKIIISIASVMLLLLIAAMWRIFEKAGEKGWQSIIPGYNMYILLKIVGKPAWWLALMFIPVANYVFIVWAYNMLSKSFGKDEGFTIGLVLLNFIFMPILAFGSAVYLGPYGDKAAFDAYQGHFTLDAERNQPN